MKKKIGPLEAWQWAAIVAVIVGAYYLAHRRASSANANVSGAPTPTDPNGPIDPTTGLPFATGGGAGAGAGAGVLPSLPDTLNPTATPAQSIAGEVSDVLSLESLLGQLNSNGNPATPDTDGSPSSAAGDPGQTQVQVTAGAKRTTKTHASKRKPKATVKRSHGGQNNPGHMVNHHAGGKKTAHSTAPSNARQHVNVAPPAHQQHHPTSHPSQPHQTGGGGVVNHPAQHPAPAPHAAPPPPHHPAPRPPARRRR